MAKVIIRSTADLYATLPQSQVDTDLPPGWNGVADENPANGAALTTSLGNIAQDSGIFIIELDAAADTYYDGNFTVPNKTGTDWVIIRSSAYANLPAAGTRVTDAHVALTGTHTGTNNQATLTDANAYGGQGFTVDGLIDRTVTNVTKGESATITDNDGTTITGTLSGSADWDTGDVYRVETAIMATVRANTADGAFNLAASSHNIRFIGVEMTFETGSVTDLTTHRLLESDAITQASHIQDSVIVDRCHIHGNNRSTQCRGGIWLNANNLGIIDSRVEEIHHASSDCQAFGCAECNGPILLQNNYLSATTEGFIFGGSKVDVTNAMPRDVTIAKNHFFKPQTWNKWSASFNSIPDASGWKCKNGLEIKSAERVLIEGNVIDGTWWGDDSQREAMVFSVRAQEHSTGNHTGGDQAETLTDSGASWITNSYVGRILRNTTDGSSGVVTANDGTTITANLLGGTNNYWSNAAGGDAYRVGQDWITIRELTVRYNKCINCYASIAFLIKDSGKETQVMKRVNVHDNLFVLHTTNNGGAGAAAVYNQLEFNRESADSWEEPYVARDIRIFHNTTYASSFSHMPALFTSQDQEVPPVDKYDMINEFTYQNNILYDGEDYAWSGSGAINSFDNTCTRFVTNLTCSDNVCVQANAGDNSASYTGFSWAANTAAVKFEDAAGGDFRLKTDSDYHANQGGGSDGKDIGADIDAINNAISGVT